LNILAAISERERLPNILDSEDIEYKRFEFFVILFFFSGKNGDKVGDKVEGNTGSSTSSHSPKIGIMLYYFQ
jgi:hypothetical protein